MVIDGITYKVCITCKELLPRGCFSKNDGYVDGWSYKCKKCLSARRKKQKGKAEYRDKKFAKAQVKRYGHAKI
jgi:hypothetical protein